MGIPSSSEANLLDEYSAERLIDGGKLKGLGVAGWRLDEGGCTSSHFDCSPGQYQCLLGDTSIKSDSLCSGF